VSESANAAAAPPARPGTAAYALTRTPLQLAGERLGTVFLSAARRRAPVSINALPQYLNTEFRIVLSDAYHRQHPSFEADAYLADYNLAVTEVKAAARAWMISTLARQASELARLTAQLERPEVVQRLHQSAARAIEAVRKLPPTPEQQQAEAASQQNLGVGIAARRLPSTRTVGDLLVLDTLRGADRAGSRPAPPAGTSDPIAAANRLLFPGLPATDGPNARALEQANRRVLREVLRDEHDDLLKVLFAHPRGVWMIWTLSNSAEAGAEQARGHLADAIAAITSLSAKLVDNPDHIWRFPAAIIGALVRLDLLQAPGFLPYMLAIAGVLAVSMLDRMVVGLGVVLGVVGLVLTGPVSVAVIGALDLVLAGATTARTFLREREQDLGARSSAFADEDERLSPDTDYTDTVLAGAAAMVSALFLLHSAGQLARAAASARVAARARAALLEGVERGATTTRVSIVGAPEELRSARTLQRELAPAADRSIGSGASRERELFTSEQRAVGTRSDTGRATGPSRGVEERTDDILSRGTRGGEQARPPRTTTFTADAGNFSSTGAQARLKVELEATHIVKVQKGFPPPEEFAEELARHRDAIQNIIDTEGLAGLRKRIETYQATKDQLEALRSSINGSLGSAGEGRAWSHYPDMVISADPFAIAGSVDARVNSIIGAASRDWAKELLKIATDTQETAIQIGMTVSIVTP
jgi:hypothetical protein